MEVGKEINLKFIDGKSGFVKNSNESENFQNDLGIDINIIEQYIMIQKFCKKYFLNKFKEEF